MKNIAILLLIATAFTAQSQSRDKRDVGSFTRVSLGIPGHLYLKQGDKNSVELEGSSEVLGKIETVVDNGKLIIRSNMRWNSWKSWSSLDEEINVYVTLKDFEGAAVTGSGKLIGKSDFTASNVDLRVSGSGSMELSLSAQDVEAGVSGSGSLNLKGKLNNLDSDISGSGRIDFNGSATNLVDVSISGSGSMNGSGNCKQVRTNISGSGRLMADDLAAEDCDVRITGSGSVRINVKTKLEAEITGSGSVTYSGNPAQVNSHTTGSGSVRKGN